MRGNKSLFWKENIEGNDRDIQQENNLLIPRIDEVNNFFIEQRTDEIYLL